MLLSGRRVILTKRYRTRRKKTGFPHNGQLQQGLIERRNKWLLAWWNISRRGSFRHNSYRDKVAQISKRHNEHKKGKEKMKTMLIVPPKKGPKRQRRCSTKDFPCICLAMEAYKGINNRWNPKETGMESQASCLAVAVIAAGSTRYALPIWYNANHIIACRTVKLEFIPIPP